MADTTESDKRTPEEIERDIAATREELAETAAAVAEKADVKKQAKAKVDEKKEQAQQKVDQVPVAAVAGGLAAIAIAIWLWRR